MTPAATRAREAAFLAHAGYADPVPLPGDASARTYDRVRAGVRRAILMRTAPADAATFADRTVRLARAGLSVPATIAADTEAGLLLLEDLGDATLGRRLADSDDPGGADGAELYAAAARTLGVLQRVGTGGLPAWDAAAMARTAAASFAEWWWPAAMDGPAPRAAAEAALLAMLRPLDAGTCAVHRDYFADNLMWLPDRHGIRRVGVLDFQDLAAGHPAYDLVSLTEDARRDIPPAARATALDAYRAATGPRPGFGAAMAVCAAQRHLRVTGLWVRLAVRDGRPGYRVHGPRTWALLERALTHPACAPLARVMDAIPADRRGVFARAA